MARFLVAAVAWLLFGMQAAISAPIVVHNTGVDASDALVAPGAQAAFWTLLTAPAGATETTGSATFRFRHPFYAPDTSTSAWVSMNANGDASVVGFYVYQLLVDLTGLDPSTAMITGQFGTDNAGFIRVNGGPNEATLGSGDFGTLTSFTLDSGFISGINSIQVGVNNEGNPTAFHVQFASATADAVGGAALPEPGSLLLLGFSLASLAFVRRKRAN